MQLKTFERTSGIKSELTQIRRAGNIPAVIYAKGELAQHVVVDGAQFRALLRDVKKGCLSITKISLEGNNGIKEAVLKEIQYNPTTYDVSHLDFESLDPSRYINVKVPIQYVGIADCVGIKSGGGTLRQVIRSMRISCLPKHIPGEPLQIDIRELQVGQTKRLSDIVMPDGIKPLADLNEVAVVIAKG